MGCAGVPIEQKKRRPSQTEILDIELARTDLKILENIETLQIMQDIQLDNPKPPIRNKWKYETKNFRPLKGRIKVELNYIKYLNLTIRDFKEYRYGIIYCGNFIDVHDLDTNDFLYRIKPIDNGKKIDFIPLIDGTFLCIGENKNYIISIIQNLGYQILYETIVKGLDLQLTDERIFYNKRGDLTLYEKDNNGIFRQKLEKKLNLDLEYFKQIRDNIIIARNNAYICFLSINNLEIISTIKYDCWNEYITPFAMITENLLLIRSNETRRKYEFIDINNKSLIDYKSSSEKDIQFDMYYGLVPDRCPTIQNMYELPDHSVYCLFHSYSGNFYTSSQIFYNKNNSKDEKIESKDSFKTGDNLTRDKPCKILVVFDNGYIIVRAFIPLGVDEYYLFI